MFATPKAAVFFNHPAPDTQISGQFRWTLSSGFGIIG